MPKGQYARKRIPVVRHAVTWHKADWPRVQSGAKRKNLSIAAFIRKCVLENCLKVQEHQRMVDAP